jgi:hypothetical protein
MLLAHTAFFFSATISMLARRAAKPGANQVEAGPR